MSLNETPRAERLHIGLFGRANSGKSSLINALTGQEAALVSDVAGTTADPVYKAMELHPVGPVVFLDTAGFDDKSELGALRVEGTRRAAEKTDIAILVFPPEGELSAETEWAAFFRERGVPVIAALGKQDAAGRPAARAAEIEAATGLVPLLISAKTGEGIPSLREEIARHVPAGYGAGSITGRLVREDDVVLLVMPQDIQAPKGRLILPQVQTIRDLLDRQCTVVCTTAERLEKAYSALSAPPALVITDSQVFPLVHRSLPKGARLTSFSVLMAQYKGDIEAFLKGAEAIDSLNENSHVLIAEACTHAPKEEDIGRVKLPRLLRKKAGGGLSVTVVSGTDFPEDLSPYDLVIHCGACMFNRRYVLSRVQKAEEQGVPITNYGVAIAKLSGILDKISF